MFYDGFYRYEIRIFKHEKLSIDMQFLVKHNGSLPKTEPPIWEAFWPSRSLLEEGTGQVPNRV